jgi:hypothetical protein
MLLTNAQSVSDGHVMVSHSRDRFLNLFFYFLFFVFIIYLYIFDATKGETQFVFRSFFENNNMFNTLFWPGRYAEVGVKLDYL